MPLLGGQKGTVPAKIETTPLLMQLQIADTPDGLQIQRTMAIDGKRLEHTPIALVGDPAVFAVVDARERYVLHPVVSQGQKLKTFTKTIHIPASDIAQFQKEYIPTLARHIPINTSSLAITLPETIHPQPILSIQNMGSMKIRVHPGFRYHDQIYPIDALPEYVTLQGKTAFFDQEKINLVRKMFDSMLPHEKPAILENMQAARFVAETIPTVQKELPDLAVEIPPELPTFTLDSSMPEVSFAIEENNESYDWFDLHVTIKIGEENVPFHTVFTSLTEEQEHFLLPSGRYFSLNTSQFDKLRQLIREAKSIREKVDGGLTLTRFQAGLWEELQQTGIVTKQSKRWQDTMRGLLSMQEIDAPQIPDTVQTTLRHYQKEGYAWLHFLRKHQLGGILADDMGLGKTIQTITLITHVVQTRQKSAKRPFLVVAPTSVVENWDMELEKFAPMLKRIIMRAGDRTKHFAQIAKTDVIVISYALLVRDFPKLSQHTFDMIVFDEAQMVKNYQSKAYGLARKLQADCKIALIGTPMENNLMELWAITSLVAPGLFPSPETFTEHYRTPIEKQQNKEVLKKLQRRIRPFILRRQKSLVAAELPAKHEQVLLLPLNPDHKRVYEKHLQYERKRVLGLIETGGLKEHRFEILRSLTKLRQSCRKTDIVFFPFITKPSFPTPITYW